MTQSPAGTRIRAANLNKRYGETIALDDVSLEVRGGEAVAIMGPSGSGKTTLLHVLAGITRPDSGEVWLRRSDDEVEVTALDDRQRTALRLTEFGFVFQQGLLIPELTAAENVAMPLLLVGVPRSDAEERAAEGLAELGLAGLGERRLGQLWGGQVQRVAIARVTAGGANTVFADEPTGASTRAPLWSFSMRCSVPPCRPPGARWSWSPTTSRWQLAAPGSSGFLMDASSTTEVAADALARLVVVDPPEP